MGIDSSPVRQARAEEESLRGTALYQLHVALAEAPPPPVLLAFPNQGLGDRLQLCHAFAEAEMTFLSAFLMEADQPEEEARASGAACWFHVLMLMLAMLAAAAAAVAAV